MANGYLPRVFSSGVRGRSGAGWCGVLAGGASTTSLLSGWETTPAALGLCLTLVATALEICDADLWAGDLDDVPASGERLPVWIAARSLHISSSASKASA